MRVAVGADHAAELARLDLEIDVVGGHHAAEAFVERSGLDDVGGFHDHPGLWLRRRGAALEQAPQALGRHDHDAAREEQHGDDQQRADDHHRVLIALRGQSEGDPVEDIG